MINLLYLIFYLFWGILQGITEPLPISSSGHLLLFKSLFNTTLLNNLNFLVFLNFASFIAIFIIYFPKIKNSLKLSKTTSYHYLKLIIVSSIPTFIIGLLFKNLIDKITTKPLMLSISFLITAIFLILASFKKGKINILDISYQKAITIGLFQAIALVPGISRSGMVLAGLLLLNIKKKDALTYTFILYFPVSIASMILEIPTLFTLAFNKELILLYAISFIVTGITTYLAYQWLVKIVNNNRLYYFSIYCLLLSLLIFLYFK